MRGMVSGLRSAVPLTSRMPAVLQGDAFLQRFVLGFDDSLAPVLATLDGISAYFDPRLAPEDFLEWLSEWVGVRLDENWPVELRRELLVNAVAVHARRGTVQGVADAVRLSTAGLASVKVRDNGAVSWSPTPGGALPGQLQPELVVEVSAMPGNELDVRRLDAVVSSSKPAHIPHRVEVIRMVGSTEMSRPETDDADL